MALIEFECEVCDERVLRRVFDSIHSRLHFCSMACKSEFQRRAKPVTPEWLWEHYIVKKWDCTQIARAVKRNSKRVWEWLIDLGIPTRPRGHDTSHLPHGRPPGFKLSRAHRRRLRQARLSDGRAPYLRNGKHWLKTVPRSQHPQWKGGITPERQRFYASDQWKRVCVKVWHRADAACERCGKHHNTAKRRGTFAIHHIKSFAVRSLRARLSNLVLLCSGCHKFVHSKKNTRQVFIK